MQTWISSSLGRHACLNRLSAPYRNIRKAKNFRQHRTADATFRIYRIAVRPPPLRCPHCEKLLAQKLEQKNVKVVLGIKIILTLINAQEFPQSLTDIVTDILFLQRPCSKTKSAGLAFFWKRF